MTLARLIVFSIASCLFTSNVFALTAKDVYQKAAPSVVVVLALDASGRPIGSGSGVVVEKDVVVTNWHVIEQASAVVIRRNNNNFHANLIADRRDRDLAVLSAPKLQAPLVAIESSVQPTVGQTVYAIGSPAGLELTLTNGLVSAVRDLGDGKLIQTNAPISPGSSGGGLFDESGKLIGITTLKLAGQGQEGLGFAIPAQWVTQLISPGSETSNRSVPSSAWLFAPLVLFAFAMLFGKRIIHLISEKFAESTARNVDASSSIKRPEERPPLTDEKSLDPKLAAYALLARREFERSQVDETCLKQATTFAGGDANAVGKLYIRFRAEKLREIEESASRPATSDNAAGIKSTASKLALRTYLIGGAILLAIGIPAIWLSSLLLTDNPAKGTGAYKAQTYKLQIENWAFNDEDLLAAAEKHVDAGNTDGAVAILDRMDYGGNSEAVFRLGELIRVGKIKNKKPEESFPYFYRAAKLGHAQALFQIGRAYKNGTGIEANAKAAFEAFKESAEKGFGPAQGELSTAYGLGTGVQQDWAKALHWANAGAKQGDALSQSNLGIIHLYGYGTRKDEGEAIKWLEKASDLGFAEAMVTLAEFYSKRSSGDDSAKALGYLERAASLGDPEAMDRLGQLYANGNGVEKSFARAAELFIAACNIDYANSCWRQGIMHLYGIHVAQDSREAEKLFRKSDSLGSSRGTLELAKLYWNGADGLPINEVQAFNLFVKAAQKGRKDAYGYVGAAYLFGKGTAANSAAALTWLEPVAEEGDGTAQAWLAEMYMRGIGAAINKTKAREWAEKSMASGNLRGKYVAGTLMTDPEFSSDSWEKGKALIREVAFAGDTYAIAALGKLYLNGHRPQTNFGLPILYTGGKGAPNHTDALTWFIVGDMLGDKSHTGIIDWLRSNQNSKADARIAEASAKKIHDQIREIKKTVAPTGS